MKRSSRRKTAKSSGQASIHHQPRPSQLFGKPFFYDKLPIKNPVSHGSPIKVDTMVSTKGFFVDFGKGWVPMEKAYGALPKLSGPKTYLTSNGQRLVSLDGKFYPIKGIENKDRFFFDAEYRCVILVSGRKAYAHVGKGRCILLENPERFFGNLRLA